jgi:hypothetical protein
MEGRVSEALQSVLDLRRDSFNQRFQQAKARDSGLDGGEFFALLQECFLPPALILADLDPSKGGILIERLYQVLLALFERRLIGQEESFRSMRQLWREVIPVFCQDRPDDLIALVLKLCNAHEKIVKRGERAVESWVIGLVAILPHLNATYDRTEQILDVGRIFAWQSGLAEYRTHALTIAERFDEGTLRSVLWGEVLPEGANAKEILEQLRRDPWFNPAEQIEDGMLCFRGSAGAFRGFGGRFIVPPYVWAIGGNFVVSVRNDWWVLIADAFGHSLHPVDPDELGEAEVPPESITLREDGTLVWGEESRWFPELAKSSSMAVVENTLAVTTELSHSIFFVTRRGKGCDG